MMVRQGAVALMFVCVLGCAGAIAAEIPAGDAERGQELFTEKCGMCHSPEKGQNTVGPSLYGVMGTKPSDDKSYTFSSALERADPTWDAGTLDKWLTKPRDMVPGTKMIFGGISNAKQRQDIIAYLASLHD
jgi:cytochrome c